MSVIGWFDLKKAMVGAAFVAASLAASFPGADRASAYEDLSGSGLYEASQYYGDQTMVASYYGYELAGSPTASGIPFDPASYTAAHKTLPLGTELLVSYGGSSVTVIVNDRGPYVGGRDLDLSQAAAETIGLTAAGADAVQVDVLS